MTALFDNRHCFCGIDVDPDQIQSAVSLSAETLKITLLPPYTFHVYFLCVSLITNVFLQQLGVISKASDRFGTADKREKLACLYEAVM